MDERFYKQTHARVTDLLLRSGIKLSESSMSFSRVGGIDYVGYEVDVGGDVKVEGLVNVDAVKDDGDKIATMVFNNIIEQLGKAGVYRKDL